jgi:hypothetical protein
MGQPGRGEKPAGAGADHDDIEGVFRCGHWFFLQRQGQ